MQGTPRRCTLPGLRQRGTSTPSQRKADHLRLEKAYVCDPMSQPSLDVKACLAPQDAPQDVPSQADTPGEPVRKSWRRDHLSPSCTQKLLMKTGLILIVIGHLNITWALVHGTVLRHIANPRDTISLQYAVSNIVTVISAILTISCGIAAIVLSRYISRKPLKWAVFSLSVGSTLLSLFCSGGLAVAIVVTFANRGHTLLELCTFANMDLIQISHECPFDPTRVYGSST
ncbi:transmembrane protein 54-like [Anolis sagrei]|uniref:transmembrane protein 54-like n=1 Tax=Anolis sagrei TaxID=38937 RepID=UPI003520DBAB